MRNKRWTVEEIELLKTKWTKTKAEELKILFPGRSYNSLLQKALYRDWETDRKSTRLNSSHSAKSRMPSSA